MRFTKRGWGNKGAFALEGEVIDANEKTVYTLSGFWHRFIKIKHVVTGEETTIWQLNPRPEQWDHLYHFSLFTLQLNYIDEDLIAKLPVTDSRLRPDQRALENGDLETATAEKHNVEEYQRKQRKEREEAGIEWKPRYFEEVPDEEVKDEVYFKFNGKYWIDRENGNLKKLARVF